MLVAPGSIDAGGYMVNSDDLFRVSAIDETIPGAMATLILALPQAMDIRQILLCKFKSVYQPLMISWSRFIWLLHL